MEIEPKEHRCPTCGARCVQNVCKYDDDAGIRQGIRLSWAGVTVRCREGAPGSFFAEWFECRPCAYALVPSEYLERSAS